MIYGAEVTKEDVEILNIGSEDIKGNEQVRETARLLSENPVINYTGFVEGDDIFKGIVNVIVCDGFVGNIALKTMEGLVKYMGRMIKDAFKKNIFTKLAAVAALFVLRSVKKNMNPDRYNGATFLGLRGIVVKSHGNTSVTGYACAIEQAISEVEHNIPKLLAHKLQKIFE